MNELDLILKDVEKYYKENNEKHYNLIKDDLRNTNLYTFESLLKFAAMYKYDSANEFTTKKSNSPIEFDSFSKKLEKAFNDGVEAEKQRCGDFNIDNYR